MHTPQAHETTSARSLPLPTPAVLAGMALGLALFQRGGAAPLALAGLLIFGALALLRPGLALLFVPLTAPLYLIPAAISGLRAEEFLLPLHEAVLLVTLGAAGAGWLWRLLQDARRKTQDARRKTQDARRFIPHLLFLVAGALGVLLAVPDGRDEALREFRRLIVEPLLFYALVKAYTRPPTTDDPEQRTKNTEQRTADNRQQTGDATRNTQHATRNTQLTHHVSPLAIAFILGGAAVGLLGLLQFVGLDVVEPLLGAKRDFSENIVEAGGLRRVTSVYGHPNNLGLYLGRIWPLAAALALFENKEQRIKNKPLFLYSWFFVLCSLLCLAGIVVSFSRAAWLGAVVAGAVLLSSILHPPSSILNSRWSVVVRRWSVALVALVVLGGLALTLRGGLGGGSDQARLLLWREALAYIRQHPLGIGLDQFYQYHNPEFGRSLIDPALLNSSEVFAAHPHNLFLDTWLRVGPLGLLAFGWLLARFLRAALARGGPLGLGALAAMAAALVHGLVDNFYFVPDLAFAFWLLLALVETPDGT